MSFEIKDLIKVELPTDRLQRTITSMDNVRFLMIYYIPNTIVLWNGDLRRMRQQTRKSLKNVN